MHKAFRKNVVSLCQAQTRHGITLKKEELDRKENEKNGTSVNKQPHLEEKNTNAKKK